MGIPGLVHPFDVFGYIVDKMPFQETLFDFFIQQRQYFEPGFLGGDSLFQQPGLMVINGEQHRVQNGVDLLSFRFEEPLAEYQLASEQFRG